MMSLFTEDKIIVDLPRSYLIDISPPASGLDVGSETKSSKSEI
jgi:hypothetical protein